jgi:hypothetical protein
MKEKPGRRVALLAAVLTAAVAGIVFIVYYIIPSEGDNERSPGAGAVPAAVVEEKALPAPAGEAGATKKKVSRGTGRTAVLRTNDDIRKEYGRVETVTLFTGKTFTGAVLSSTAEEYAIVTVGGVVKVPMRNVKMRVILR